MWQFHSFMKWACQLCQYCVYNIHIIYVNCELEKIVCVPFNSTLGVTLEFCVPYCLHIWKLLKWMILVQACTNKSCIPSNAFQNCGNSGYTIHRCRFHLWYEMENYALMNLYFVYKCHSDLLEAEGQILMKENWIVDDKTRYFVLIISKNMIYELRYIEQIWTVFIHTLKIIFK